MGHGLLGGIVGRPAWVQRTAQRAEGENIGEISRGWIIKVIVGGNEKFRIYSEGARKPLEGSEQTIIIIWFVQKLTWKVVWESNIGERVKSGKSIKKLSEQIDESQWCIEQWL
jgi:hypothetical protein